jgi:hypothetical protein
MSYQTQAEPSLYSPTSTGTTSLSSTSSSLSKSGRTPVYRSSNPSTRNWNATHPDVAPSFPIHSMCYVPEHRNGIRPHLQPQFRPYPNQEYKASKLELISSMDQSDHPRHLEHPYFHLKKSPSINENVVAPPLADIHRRHDLHTSLLRHNSTSDYNHGRKFIAKHTNTLYFS